MRLVDNLRAESGETIDLRFLFLGSLFGYRQQEIEIKRTPISTKKSLALMSKVVGNCRILFCRI
jgi:hypothetical protein